MDDLYLFISNAGLLHMLNFPLHRICKVQKSTTPMNKSTSAKNTETYNVTISQTNPRPQ